MQRQNKVLAKDSEQLANERRRITQLTLDVTKAKEKEEQMSVALKDSEKKLKKNSKELKETTEKFDDQKQKLDYSQERFDDLTKKHNQLTKDDDLATKENVELRGSNENFRELLIKNEGILSTQTAELKEL